MELDCNGCGRKFTAARSDARYCSPRCRTAAHRSRNAPEPVTPRKRRPITDAFRDAQWDLRRSVERIGRLIEDDRTPRNRQRLRDAHLSDLMRQRDRLDTAIAYLSQDESSVTDVARVSDNAPRPFKKSDAEMLAEITSSLSTFADLIQWVRPDAVGDEDAAREASRARVAWQEIDRRLRRITAPRV